MSVTFYRLTGDKYEAIGRVEDGVIVEGEEALPAITARAVEGADEEAVTERFNGPYLIAAIDEGRADVPGEPVRR